MRKLFIGTMMTSLLGALAIGAVLAWTGSATGPATATAGSVSVVFDGWTPDPLARVVPNDSWIKVAESGFKNTGDIDVHATGGSVAGINVPGDGACNGFLAGAVNVLGVPISVAPGGTSGHAYDVYLKMGPLADEGCQGRTIDYDVTITVGT